MGALRICCCLLPRVIIIIIIIIITVIIILILEEKILLTTMLTIKILFTINSLEKKKKNYSFKTLFTIPDELKST